MGRSLIEVAYEVAAELRSQASVGLAYANNEYDRVRYLKILDLAERLVVAGDGQSAGGRPIRSPLPGDFEDNTTYICPRVGVDAVVARGETILLVQRADNGLWCLPGGWVEVGETLAEAALRELSEEAGVQGEVLRLLGVFDSRLWRSLVKVHMYHFALQVNAGDQIPHTGQETLATGFFREDTLPPLAAGHIGWVPLIFKLLRGEIEVPYFDLSSHSE